MLCLERMPQVDVSKLPLIHGGWRLHITRWASAATLIGCTLPDSSHDEHEKRLVGKTRRKISRCMRKLGFSVECIPEALSLCR